MTAPTSPLRRLAPYLALTALGFLLATSAGSFERPGPRLARVDDLVGLIRREDSRVRSLRTRLDDLVLRLQTIEASAAGRETDIARLRKQIDALVPIAGLLPVSGPGVSVELRDSTLQTSPTGDPNDLVVHEQDIQAVVNALWASGAEAIAVNGERITAVSAIRCVGNTLLLHGSVYSPPYTIAAVGDQAAMLAGLEADPLVERVRIVAQEFGLGYTVTPQPALDLPEYRGVFRTRYAREPA